MEDYERNNHFRNKIATGTFHFSWNIDTDFAELFWDLSKFRCNTLQKRSVSYNKNCESLGLEIRLKL